MHESVVVNPQYLAGFITTVLERLKVPAADAKIVSDCLVFAHLRGFDTRTSRSTRRRPPRPSASRGCTGGSHRPPYPDGSASRPAGLLASGSSAPGAFPDARPSRRRSTAASGILPGASPVTVAGAARESHPLP